MIVIVEGNIGAGKSTFASALCEVLKAYNIEVTHIEEPVEAWKNFNGHNLLQTLYEDKKRWAFAFQVNALIDTLENESKALDLSQEGHVVVLERSSFSVREIFCQLMSDTVFEPIETAILKRMGEAAPSYIDNNTKKVIIYLRTDPSVCYERLVDRSRPEEVGKIDIEYIERLHAIHEDKLTATELNAGTLLVADGNTLDRDNAVCVKLAGCEQTTVFDILKKLLIK